MAGSATVTLPADEQILITRELDAPKELVYKAWTTPEADPDTSMFLVLAVNMVETLA